MQYKNLIPFKVAIVAAFLFYELSFISKVEDKNIVSLPFKR